MNRSAASDTCELEVWQIARPLGVKRAMPSDYVVVSESPISVRSSARLVDSFRKSLPFALPLLPADSDIAGFRVRHQRSVSL